jgi:CubicO group peptidase (beta-lactamase class C family)
MFKSVPAKKGLGGDWLNTTLAAERLDAAGGIVSTLPDLAKLASALFRGKFLLPDTQKFLMAASEGMDVQPIGKHRIGTLQAIRKPYGVLLYKEGDSPGGINTLMAYLPAHDKIFVGFINSFGNFNEVNFMMDEVIGLIAASK